MPRHKGRLSLPANPNLEFLRNQAKERLAVIRSHAPDAQLSDAQFALARDYGFSSWQALHAEVQKSTGRLGAYTGSYRYDPALMTNMAFDVSLRDGKLVIGRSNAARFEVAAKGEDEFVSPGLSTVYRFERNAKGDVDAMVVTTEGRTNRAARIDARTRRQMSEDEAKALKDERRPRSAIVLAPEIIERYAGHYASDFGHVFEITRDGDRLFYRGVGQPHLQLSAESEQDFFLGMLPFWIHFCIEDGRVTGLQHHQTGIVIFMKRVSAEIAAKAASAIEQRLAEQLRPRNVAAIDVAVLPHFAGRYRVGADRIMTVTVEGSHLFAQMTNQPRFEIYPEATNKFFFTAAAAQVEFFFDSSGRVSHAVLHQAGRLIPLGRMEDDAQAA